MKLKTHLINLSLKHVQEGQVGGSACFDTWLLLLKLLLSVYMTDVSHRDHLGIESKQYVARHI